MNIPTSKNKRIVIIGGGFAGIELAKALKNKPFQVVLFDRNNYFTFQPLLYQVAMSGLEANSVVYPFRHLFRGRKNFYFRMANVRQIDTERREIETDIGSLRYDYLVLATGSRPRFFGLNPDQLLPLKSIPQAIGMRNFLLTHFERALDLTNDTLEKSHLNIVVVGGGPTGVELAGALGEMKKQVIPKSYPELDPSKMKIYLLEGQSRLLPTMSEEASGAAERYLKELGVITRLNALVNDYDGELVHFNEETIRSKNLIWTAGVEGAAVPGVEDARAGKSNRIAVDDFHRVRGYRNIFAVGDVAKMKTDAFPNGHPMLAQAAIQQGKHLARNLSKMAGGEEPEAFVYNDKGAMATVGRNRAVVDLPKFKFQGMFAWFVWMFVHLVSLIGFRNKLVTMVNWIYNYFTYDRSLWFIMRSEGKMRRYEKAIN